MFFRTNRRKAPGIELAAWAGCGLLSLCVAGATHSVRASPPMDTPATHRELLRDIEAAHTRELQEEGVIGAGFLVADRKGLLGRYNFGFADVERRNRVDEDTIFHWASVTKILTSVAAMQLVERGLLSLDAPVVSFLPEIGAVHNRFGSMDAITVRHLLTHSSGFRGPTWPWKDEAGWQPHEPRSWSQLVAMMPYTEIRFEPGTRYGYSNLGAIFIGRIIQTLTGDTIEAYIDKNIFKPLGMYRSYFDMTPWHLAESRSHGYYAEEGGPRSIGPDFDTGITAANGGLNAPLSDMRRFADFLAGNSETEGILQHATLAQMFEPVFPVSSDQDRDVSVGLGFFIADNRTPGTGDVVRWVGHSGYQLTHRSSFMVNPAAGQVFLAAANTVRRHGGNPSEVQLRRRLLNEFFPSLSGR
ncbi:MAG: serine hydrolase [Gammaproteobacteria bacterium]|nr:serine hydrolase [Gammaproteobacteria bacterium]